MLLILLTTILVLAIAFFQVTQGLFSALMMTVLSLVSLIVAFNYYEPLARLLYPYQPASADGIALVVIFVVVLLALRILGDRFIKRNVVMGLWVDRIGGGALGILTGMLLVGVLAVVMQMLPWGESILGYRPFDDSLRRSQRLYLFAPDDFVVGTVRALSGQSLGSRAGFGYGSVHDDLLRELFCARNTAGRGGRIDARTDALTVEGAYSSPGGMWGVAIPTCPMLSDQITKVVVVRVEVDRRAAGGDGWWRLPGTHFRLVGESGRSYYPLGYLATSSRGWECVSAPSSEGVVQPALLIAEKRAGNEQSVTVDWVFRMLTDDKPDHMVFRRVSRAIVPKVASRLPDPAGAMKAPGAD